MKRLLLIILAALSTIFSYSQSSTKGYLKYDSLFILKDGGNGELILKNSTRNTPGYLYNTGGGITQFKIANFLDSIYYYNGNIYYRINNVVSATPIPFGIDTAFFNRGLGSDTLRYNKNSLTYTVGIINKPEGLISGGIVTWSGTGLVFDVTAATYYIDGIRYNSNTGQVTLVASDTVPRLDVVYVDNTGSIGVITGDPSANPAKPQVDPATQIELTSILIPAGSTTPGNITQTIIYDENIEFGHVTNGITPNFDNSTNPFHLTKSVDVGGWSTGTRVFSFVSPTVFSISGYSALKLYIRLKSAMPTSANITLSWGNGASTFVSSSVRLLQVHGFNKNLIGTYQLVSIPLSTFGFSNRNVDRLRFTLSGAMTNGFYLDYVQLQGAIDIATPGNFVTNVFKKSGTDSVFQVINNNNIFSFQDAGVISLSAIGSTPNANGASLSGSTLNLQPADSLFGGVLTTQAQKINGAKTALETFTIKKNAISGREYILRSYISDAGNDQFYIANGTNVNGRFNPIFGGYLASVCDCGVMNFRALTSATNDNDGEAMINLVAAISSDPNDPNNVIFSDVLAKPILAVSNGATHLLKVSHDGIFTFSKYLNNVSGDSVLTTDASGNLKFKLVSGGSGSRFTTIVTTAALQALSNANYDYAVLNKTDDYNGSVNGLYQWNNSAGEFTATGGGFWKKQLPAFTDDGGFYDMQRSVAIFSTATSGYSHTYSASKPPMMVVLRNDAGEIVNNSWGGMISGSAAGGAINVITDASNGANRMLQLGVIDNSYNFTNMLEMHYSGTGNSAILRVPFTPGTDSSQSIGTSSLRFKNGFFANSVTGITESTSDSSKKFATTEWVKKQGFGAGILHSTSVADANYTITSTDYLIAYTSISAPRTVTLPAASSVPNHEFIIKDESGSASNSLSISINGTVDGIVNPGSVIAHAYGSYTIYSNGVSYFAISFF